MFTKYFEKGLAVIPLNRRSKAPVAEALGYPRWATERQTPQLIERWDSDYPVGIESGFNIGVIMGEVSGIWALDVDTLHPEIVAVLPRSPVIRKGRPDRYGMLFFKRSPHLPPWSKLTVELAGHFSEGVEVFPGKHEVDLLRDGRYAVLPPSLHPLGMRFLYGTGDTLLDFDVRDLPEITQPDLDRVTEVFQKLERAHGLDQEAGHSKNEYGGRNDHIKSIITAKRMAGESEADIVEAIYQYDLKNNVPPLFRDPDEKYAARTEDEARRNALKMVNSVTRSLLGHRDSVMPIPSATPAITISLQEHQRTSKPSKFKPVHYPRARGIMAKFVECCEIISDGNQDALGLGGAIALMSVICSNRYVTKIKGKTTSACSFTFCLASSSFGKDDGQKLINEILINTDETLLGSASYRSGTAVFMTLPHQQERIDLIDECSQIIRAMASREDYKAEMVEVLSSLYSKSNSKFMGVASAGAGEKYGACWNPCVTLLGSTTPAGFRESVNRDMAAKGLLPRFFLFHQETLGRYKGRQSRADVPKLQAEIEAFVASVLRVEKVIHPKFNPDAISLRVDRDGNPVTEGIRYLPYVIPFSPEAEEFFLQADEKWHDFKGKYQDTFESAFVGRFGEKSAKLALLDAISLDQTTIELHNIQWAISVVEAEWHNARPLYELATAENQTESYLLRVLKLIQNAGSMDKATLTKNTRFLKGPDRNNILQQLVEQNAIECVKIHDPKKTGPAKEHYRAVMSELSELKHSTTEHH